MGVRLSITIADGPEKGDFLEFTEGPVVLGRTKGEIQLTDKKVSGRHCQFHIEEDKVILEDLQSTNGTFLGSKKVEGKIELNNMDVVTVGLTRLNIAIVEELEDFKSANQAEGADDETIQDPNFEEPSQPAAIESPPNSMTASEDVQTRMKSGSKDSAAAIPPESAEYRETGIKRIEDLIDDEMSAFSQWDHPGMKESGESSGGSIPKIQVVLVARKAPEGVSQVNCTGPKTTLGRKDVDVRLNDLDLSRKHSCIEIVGGTKAFVRDLASTNGTFVNGNKVTYQELKQGDLIQVGQSVFEVQIQEES